MLHALRHCSESNANPVFLDPGNSALANRGVACHHQAKLWRDERRVLNVNGGPFDRNISDHAAHDGSAGRDIGRFVDFGPWMLALFFHQLRPCCPIAGQRYRQTLKNMVLSRPDDGVGRKGRRVRPGHAFLFSRRCPAYPQASVLRIRRVASPARPVRRRDARLKRTCARGKTPCSRYSIDARV